MQSAGSLDVSRAPGRLYDRRGAPPATGGARFAVCAPGAHAVSVIGDFNRWDTQAHPLKRRRIGVWEGTVPAAAKGQRYKYHVVPRAGAGQAQGPQGAVGRPRPAKTVDRTVRYAFGLLVETGSHLGYFER